ncbi:Unknown protein, partial [Striga hermonthica]
VNLRKSSIFFSKNVNVGMQEDICAILEGIRVHSSSRYLGLPRGIGKSKKETF